MSRLKLLWAGFALLALCLIVVLNRSGITGMAPAPQQERAENTKSTEAKASSTVTAQGPGASTKAGQAAGASLDKAQAPSGAKGVPAETAAAAAATPSRPPRIDLSKDYAVLNGNRVHPFQLMVRLREKTDRAELDSLLKLIGWRVKKTLGTDGTNLVLERMDQNLRQAVQSDHPEVERGQALGEVLKTLKQSGLFEYVEPDGIMSTQAEPTDSAFAEGLLWGLKNTGAGGGLAGADIDAVRAWDITTGSTDVIVGVIDTGVRYTHQDLKTQMWVNPGEIPGNGKDDDGDGVVDDVYGFNGVEDSGDPMDDNGHGTHVAGTIGASANDAGGHVGVAWKVRIMALKFLSSGGGGSTSDAVECIDYAVKHGARILSNSWGGGGYSQSLADAVSRAEAKGVLFVAAAGNSSLDTDLSPNYPSTLPNQNIVAVAAVDSADAKASFSNYGATTVHLGAPGVAIHSTWYESDSYYNQISGTSMATPHVSGVAALLLAKYPNATWPELKRRLLQGAVKIPSLNGRCTTGGRLNAYNALTLKGDGMPDVELYPTPGSSWPGGRSLTLRVAVSDLASITNASVSVSLPDGTSYVCRNDGVAPDLAAQDEIYTTTIIVPKLEGAFDLAISVDVPGAPTLFTKRSYKAFIPPVNDQFADSRTLSGGSAEDVIDASRASAESGEPSEVASAGKSLWWTWTAPADAKVTLDTSGSTHDTLLTVYRGDSLSMLQRLFSDDNAGDSYCSKLVFYTKAGATYRIQVDSVSAKAGLTKLKLSTEAPPARPVNDDFEAAIEMDESGGLYSASNDGATLQAGEPNGGEGMGDKSLWWRWTPAYDANYIVDLSGTLAGGLSVYSGASLSTLSLEKASSFNQQASLLLEAKAGVTYYLRVASKSAGGSVFNFRFWRSYPGVSYYNDNFRDAWDVSGFWSGVAMSGFSMHALSREQDEADHGGVSAGHSMWFTYKPERDDYLSISSLGSDFDTVVAIYKGESLSTLEQVGFNDDAAPGKKASKLVIPVKAGQRYYAVLDVKKGSTGLDSRGGRVDFHAKAVPVDINNDDFANAQEILTSEKTFVTDSSQATRESGEPNHAGLVGGKSLWWKWMAVASGTISLSTEGSTFDTTLAVYTGSDLSKLSCVANNDNDGIEVTSKLAVAVEKGKTYYLAVDGFNGGGGLVKLSFKAPGMGAYPSNGSLYRDNFASAGDVTGGEPGSGGGMILESTYYATTEAGEPLHGGLPGGHSVWIKFTTSKAGRFQFDARNCDFDTMLALYEGTTLANLKPLAFSNDFGGQKGSFIEWDCEPGHVYYAAVDGVNGAWGRVEFFVNRPRVPQNDDFDKATAITGGSQGFSTLEGATTQAGEPRHGANLCGHTVWFKYTDLETKKIRFHTLESVVDTALAVYTGDRVDGLTLVAANDDAIGGAIWSDVTIQAEAGRTYYIAVDAKIPVGDISLACMEMPGWGFGPPVFSQAPWMGSFRVGASVVIYGTTANGEAPIYYQWQRQTASGGAWENLSDGAEYLGSRGTRMTILSTSLAMDGEKYRCVATNAKGQGVSAEIPLRMAMRTPLIVQQPVDAIYKEGGEAVFSVAVQNPEGITYSWTAKDAAGQYVELWGLPFVSGKQASTLKLSPVTADIRSWTFYCDLYNALGSVTTRSVSLKDVTPPVITSHPSDQSLNHQLARFSAEASATPEPQYRWQSKTDNGDWVYLSDGGVFSGTLSQTLLVSSPPAAYNGLRFRCVASNANGSAATRAAVLSTEVREDTPRFIRVPGNGLIFDGEPAVFEAEASGAPDPKYLWQFKFSFSETWLDCTAEYGYEGGTSTRLVIAQPSMSFDGVSLRCVAYNTVGTAMTSELLLTTKIKPRFIDEPRDLRALADSSAGVVVKALLTGRPYPSVEWQLKAADGSWTKITTMTHPGFVPDYGTLTINRVYSTGTVLTLRCVLSNGYGDPRVSREIKVTYEAARSGISISRQPEGVATLPALGCTFSVSADACPSPTFQWECQFPGSDIWKTVSSQFGVQQGDVSPVLQFPGLNMEYSGLRFRCKIQSAPETVYTQVVKLLITRSTSAPEIVSEPADVGVEQGLPAQYAVSAVGNPNVTYAWQRRAVGGNTWVALTEDGQFSGVATATLNFAATYSMSGDAFRCQLTNSEGTLFTRVAALTVTDSKTMRIVTHPLGQSLISGTGLKLSVGVVGAGPFQYQWKKDGVAIAGANAASYTLPSVSKSQAGSYTCVVTDPQASVESRAAVVTVIAATQISAQPVSKIVALSGELVLSVDATGEGKLSYQWKKNGVLIPGATSSTLSLKGATADFAGSYTCVVTGSAGAVETSAAVITVAEAGKLSALAVRSICGEGDKLLIVGYVLDGSSKKKILVRGLGPNLLKQGVTSGYLEDPSIRVFALSGQEIAANDDWDGDPSLDFSEPLGRGTKDAAISVNLDPGVYSATVFDTKNRAGDAMLEIFDSGVFTKEVSTTRFSALSLRVQLDVGQTIIPGIVVSGPGPRKLVIRVLGPSLALMDSSLAVHPDPRLAVYSGNQRILENDNWSGENGSSIGLLSFPSGSKDAVIIADLQPGPYSIHVFGNGTKGGLVLVEIYEMP